jgi:hypothetical protein
MATIRRAEIIRLAGSNPAVATKPKPKENEENRH